jgi:CRISPR-associated protein Cas1
MIKRTLEISTDGHFLSVKNDQLVLSREREVVSTIPCEDVGLLIVDSKSTIFTHDALVRVCEYGGFVVLCGSNHHPAAMLVPTVANEIQTQRVRLQATAKLPLVKQMWRQIVQTKIRNQGGTLPDAHPARTALFAMVPKVRSGDPANVEARASRLYWPALFNDAKFRRQREGQPPNNLLNYGYMALRAATARAVCGAGLHPSLGLSHHNKYNPFCLADDLMEPYRPFVDRCVVKLVAEGKIQIDQETKRELLAVLTQTVTVGDADGPLMVALHKTASSVVNVLSGEEERLALPQP